MGGVQDAALVFGNNPAVAHGGHDIAQSGFGKDIDLAAICMTIDATVCCGAARGHEVKPAGEEPGSAFGAVLSVRVDFDQPGVGRSQDVQCIRNHDRAFSKVFLELTA